MEYPAEILSRSAGISSNTPIPTAPLPGYAKIAVQPLFAPNPAAARTQFRGVVPPSSSGLTTTIAAKQLVPALPEREKRPIFVEPTPFTPEQIRELQAQKIPFEEKITMPNVRCASCYKVIRMGVLEEFETRVKQGEDPGVVLDDLGLGCIMCRTEILKTPVIARGVWLLPEEKADLSAAKLNSVRIVVETQQRPIREVRSRTIALTRQGRAWYWRKEETAEFPKKVKSSAEPESTPSEPNP